MKSEKLLRLAKQVILPPGIDHMRIIEGNNERFYITECLYPSAVSTSVRAAFGHRPLPLISTYLSPTGQTVGITF